KQPIWTVEHLRLLKFPSSYSAEVKPGTFVNLDFLADVDALAKRTGEPYLDYIQRLAMRPMATKIKWLDLEENSSDERFINSPVDEQSLQIKKECLYPVSKAYLAEVDK